MDQPDATGSIEIEAPPELVYDLVSDVPNMPTWAAECVRCRWMGDATEAVPGARFVGSNRNGRFRWSTVAEVTAAEPARRFAFTVLMTARWEYVIEPIPTGCRVTESTWDIRNWFMRRILAPAMSGVTDRGRHNTANIAATLASLKTAAESRHAASR